MSAKRAPRPPEERRKYVARMRARERAMRILARRHPEEFEELLRVEMKARGVVGSPKFMGVA